MSFFLVSQPGHDFGHFVFGYLIVTENVSFEIVLCQNHVFETYSFADCLFFCLIRKFEWKQEKCPRQRSLENSPTAIIVTMTTTTTITTKHCHLSRQHIFTKMFSQNFTKNLLFLARFCRGDCLVNRIEFYHSLTKITANLFKKSFNQ